MACHDSEGVVGSGDVEIDFPACSVTVKLEALPDLLVPSQNRHDRQNGKRGWLGFRDQVLKP